MKTKIALLVVLAILVGIWYQRGARNPFSVQRLGATAGAIDTAYQSERAWAIREIAADISEMARYGNSPGDAPAVADAIAPWHPGLLTAYAAKQLAPAVDRSVNEHDPPAQYDDLLNLTPDAILKANTLVSRTLQRDMRNPRAHEAAALVVGAFGLRESAGRMTDVRWTMNRMTAHLAIAAALRNGQSPASVDGQLAEIVLMAIANRQKTAVAALDAMPAGDASQSAWLRALRMRVTQDWRLMTAPATASRLEKLEYFRARRATMRGVRSGQDLTDMRELVSVDFARIGQSRSMGVEDGNDYIVEGLSHELAELNYVYRQLPQRELPKELPAEIVNARAGRLLANGDPQVIPWGAWAEFAQRHIGQSIIQLDNHYRYMLGASERADAMKAELDRLMGHLTLYSPASTRRNKGVHSTEADMSRIDAAVDVGLASPELLTFDIWSFIELGTHYEPVKRTIPQPATWFTRPSADVPYDAATRVETARLKPQEVEALIEEASSDVRLLSRVLQRFKTNKTVAERVRLLLEPRADYDLFAIDAAISVAAEPAARLALRKKACELTTVECDQYAWDLTLSDEAAAAVAFEKAFSNPALDRVAMAASSPWLVLYYENHGQPAKAVELATWAASTGSATGMSTLGRLHERHARLDEADELFSSIADRYDDKAELAGFLYRQAVVEKKAAYLERWKKIEGELFPNGLRPVPAAMAAKPATGVFVEKDTLWSRKVRLQAGDIIVGVDGWLVENYKQYDAIMSFVSTEAPHKYAAWRGVLFNVDLMARHGMTLKSHPLKGWME